MNIHGLKLQVEKLKQELKKGKNNLGSHRFNALMRKKERLTSLIKKIKKERDKRKSKI